jgi:hypothetical protein
MHDCDKSESYVSQHRTGVETWQGRNDETLTKCELKVEIPGARRGAETRACWSLATHLRFELRLCR